MTERRLEELLKSVPHLRLEEAWLTTDVRPGRDTEKWLNVILRKAYGSAYVTMNSKHIGADVVYAWPTADISVMNSVSAARIMFAKDVEAGADLSEKAADFEVLSSPYAAASRGYIDDIIEPALTRKHLLVALGMLISKRQEGPAKKHGTIL